MVLTAASYFYNEEFYYTKSLINILLYAICNICQAYKKERNSCEIPLIFYNIGNLKYVQKYEWIIILIW